jgi:hypothetical protein
MLFISCDDDGYSLDDFVIDIATVENPDNSNYFYLRLDDGKVLWMAATNLYNYKPQTGQRILANFTLLSDRPENSGYNHDIKLNDAYNILTKGIFNITPETQDSIGYNPIEINDMWIGSNYLNVEFYYRGYNKTHYITLAKDDSKEYDDGKIHLEFRHNACNDQEIYKGNGIVSFNLIALQALTSEKTLDLAIHVKKYDTEETTYEFKYNFGEKDSRSEEFNNNYFTNTETADVK